MDVADLIRAHGGFMRWTQITGHASQRQLRGAVSAGTVLRLAAGGYALPDTPGPVAALQLRGVLSHRSAAAHWQFALPPGPEVEHVTIPWKARRSAPTGVVLHYRNLAPRDVRNGVTSRLQTVIDCIRDLNLRDALAVGDSALRSGLVTHRQLAARGRSLRGPGSARVRQRIDLLDARAENTFESSCRAILIAGRIRGFRPQLSIRDAGRFLGRVDLGNDLLRIVLECESFAHHGDRLSLRRDCRRYTELEAAGWSVLRVTWEHVMFDPQWVLTRVRDAVAIAERRLIAAQRRPRRAPGAS